MTISDNVSVGNTARNFSFDDGTSTFTNNTSCDGGDDDRIVGNDDGSNQFWSEETGNGARCSEYTGELEWSFAEDGSLVVTFGGTAVTQ
jgi:hypothetical protein